MYEILSPDGMVLFEINYSECCIHPWCIERYDRVGSRWVRSRWYRKFDTLQECRTSAGRVIKSLKIPTKPSH